jgi:pimeloyl-ACP methyl ester carboxylesterase
VDSRTFEPNLEILASRFHAFPPERRGHGGTPDVDGPYSYELVADDMIRFLEHMVGGPSPAARGEPRGDRCADRGPEAAGSRAAIDLRSGVFHNRGWIPGVIEPGKEPPDFLIARYGEVSPDGQEHFRVVQEKLDEMHAGGPTLTEDDLKGIRCRTLVLVGDDDEMTLEHAVDFYRALPDGELAMIPGSSHGRSWRNRTSATDHGELPDP